MEKREDKQKNEKNVHITSKFRAWEQENRKQGNNQQEYKDQESVKLGNNPHNKILSDLASFNTLSGNMSYGEANTQYFRAYTGVTEKDGKIVQKGLKQIHNHKVNSKHEYSNRKSNAGFAAEIDEVARTNAENIIKGSDIRVARSNDVGRGNDPIFDIVFTDKAGNVIEDATGNASGYQMKIKGRFVGDEMIGGTPLPTDPILRQKTIIKSYDHVIDDLSKAKNERYLDGGVAVGKEQYAPFKQRCEEKYQELTTQAKALRKEGKIERATELEARAKRTKKLGDNLVKAKDTSKDAADSYMKPKVTTAKRVLNVSFKAGINQAEYAAVMSSVSVGINSIVAVSKGDMDAEEAIKVTAKSTAKSAATGFVVGAGDSMLRGYLGNSKNQTLEKLSRSNMPMQIARMTKQLSGSVKRVITGEIDTKQFLQEIGSQQAGMLVGSWGGLVGSTAVGAATKSTLLQAAGAAAGSTIALLVFSSLYQSAMQVYQEERMSEEHLAAVREFCRYAKQQMREEEEKLRENIAKTYGKRQALFEQCIDELEDAFKNQKADQFVDALSKIAGEMGSCLQFKNFDEFDVFMRDDSLSLEF